MSVIPLPRTPNVVDKYVTLSVARSAAAQDAYGRVLRQFTAELS